MRKRLFIFAAATCFALSAFATPAFAGEPNLTDGPTIGSEASVQSDGNSNGNPNGNSNGNPDGNPDGNVKEDALPGGSNDALPNGENNNSERQTNPSVAAPVVAKIGETEYPTLQAAIDAACLTSSDATITLQSDLELNNEGLRFIGSDDPNVPWKKITLDADNHSLTLNDLGIYATRCEVTIKNCRELTVNAGTNPGSTDGSNTNISAVLFCPGTLTLNSCDTVNITNPEPTTGGSGLCIYNGGDLYIQNNTHFTVSGFMNRTSSSSAQEGQGGCSGIYIDSDKNVNENYKKITGQIVVSNNSTLTATECYHNGITANPIDILVSDHSTIDVHNNNKNSSGQGGIGCYYGKLTVTNNSHVTAHNNTSWGFAIFVKDLKVDGTSVIDANDNGGYTLDKDGLGLGGYGVTVCGSADIEGTVNASGNWGPGLAVFHYHPTGDRSLTVRNGGKIVCSNNFNYGIANDGVFTVEPGGTVTLEKNWMGGFDNYPGATLKVEEKANFTASENYGMGIKNGNSSAPEPATLVLNSGVITENHNGSRMPSLIPGVPTLGWSVSHGGGIYNEYGSVSLSTTAKVYNNHADKAGDDLYNANKGGNIFNIIELEPGAKGQVLSDDEKIIDDWYHDAEGEGNRWKETNAKNNTNTILPLGAALKAAHGINAPTPSPKPAEPTAAPTAAPTTAPTVAPTAAPTAAPADNTATAAPATPAPTAQPTVTATPAPTAQASGVIPQTGDSSSPALFSILTLGSITALCVLQKRRKSK